MEIYVFKNTCKPKFTAVLFTIAKKAEITQMSMIRRIDKKLDCGKLQIHMVIPKTTTKKYKQI